MLVGLSFGGLHNVVEKVDMKDASKSRDPSERPLVPTLKDMFAEVRQRQSPSSSGIWGLYLDTPMLVSVTPRAAGATPFKNRTILGPVPRQPNIIFNTICWTKI